MPALDILELDQNEGAHHQQDLKLLFAGRQPYQSRDLNYANLGKLLEMREPDKNTGSSA